MNNIENHLTNINDNLDKLIHDDIQSYIGDYKKINIYNNNIQVPLQKIWLLTPKLKMNGKIYVPNKQKQSGLLTLILYDLDPEVKKFKQFIINIEEYITNIIHSLGYDNLTLKSCIKCSDTFFPSLTVQLPLNKKDNDIYDVNNKKIKCDEIENGSFVLTYIELTDVWINSKDYGINWNVLHTKIYPEFNFKKCLFTDGPQNTYDFIDINKNNKYKDKDKDKDNSDNDITFSQSQTRLLPNKKEIMPVNNDTNKSFAPSISDLLNTLNKMKLKKSIENESNNNHMIISKNIKNPINETVDETVNETVNEMVDETVNETVDETVDETVNETVDETVNEILDKTVNETVNENDVINVNPIIRKKIIVKKKIIKKSNKKIIQ